MNALFEGIQSLLRDPWKLLLVSLGVNLVLGIGLVRKEGIKAEVGTSGFKIELSRSLVERIDDLVADDTARHQVRPLLAERGFFEISEKYRDNTAAVERALAALSEKHDLVAQLRRLSQEHRKPFAPRQYDATVRVSTTAEPPKGQAVLCADDDPHDQMLVIWDADMQRAVEVEATRRRVCPLGAGRYVVLSQSDAAQLCLQVKPDSTAATKVQVYLHAPKLDFLDGAPANPVCPAQLAAASLNGR
jgi:hypothetical protein